MKTYTECQYRNCRKPLPEKKLRYHAKFCDSSCKWAEYAAQQNDREQVRHDKNLARFERFHADHPEVLHNMQRLAAKESGKISVKYLYELTRKQLSIGLDNTFTRYYSLMLIETMPELKGRIKFRGDS